jgi:hypothetical protein
VVAHTVVPPYLKKLIVDGFSGMTPDNNPVEKVTLLISGDGDRIRILDLMIQDGTSSEGADHTTGGNITIASGGEGKGEEMVGLLSLLYQQQTNIEETKRKKNERTDRILHATKGLGISVHIIAHQPVIRRIG